MTGRAEVAIDPVGNDNTDMFVHLRPKKEWTTAHDLDDLSVAIKNAIESEVPGTFVSVSQPIEDKTNELISGSRADVQIAVFGDELAELKRISEEVGALVRNVRGTGDVRVERVLGAPTIAVRPDRARLARYGVASEDALSAIEAARVGMQVGSIYEGHRRFDLRLVVPPRTSAPEALGELFVEAAGGRTVPLSEVAKIEETEGPTQVRREALTRTVRVDVNLRGRDLVSWVDDARAQVQKQVKLPSGYEIEWGGQFENFERAKTRLALVVPMALAIIFGMLLWMFQSARYAVAVFAVVPFALTGGILGLVARGLLVQHPGRGRLHRARRRRRAQRRRHGRRREAPPRRRRAARRGDHRRRDAHDARRAHDRRGRGVRLPADGDRDRRRRRGAAAARHRRRLAASSSRRCSRCSSFPGVIQIMMTGWKPEEEEEPIHEAPPNLRHHGVVPPGE